MEIFMLNGWQIKPATVLNNLKENLLKEWASLQKHTPALYD